MDTSIGASSTSGDSPRISKPGTFPVLNKPTVVDPALYYVVGDVWKDSHDCTKRLRPGHLTLIGTQGMPQATTVLDVSTNVGFLVAVAREQIGRVPKSGRDMARFWILNSRGISEFDTGVKERRQPVGDSHLFASSMSPTPEPEPEPVPEATLGTAAESEEESATASAEAVISPAKEPPPEPAASRLDVARQVATSKLAGITDMLPGRRARAT